ncbi:MAG: hypothetical protein IK066_00010 [Kiritimatiellae bacterium]|nr:hypothetical protein [Kiritimatiellia bacterium]
MPRVVACGGGLALNPDALPVILSRATAVCLEASPAVLADRLARDPTPRPLLDQRPLSQSLPDRIAELLALRAPAYARIPRRLDVSSDPLPALLDRLSALARA